jgi:hypothetical protein
MKRIYLIVLALSVFVNPMPLLGQQGTDGSGGSTKGQEAFATSARCGTAALIASAADPQKKGECRCPPMAGAQVSGCGDARDEVDCGQKTCHYKVFDIQRGTVSDEGDIDCEWHPGGVQ